MNNNISDKNPISNTGYVSPFAGNEYVQPPADALAINPEARTQKAAALVLKQDSPETQYKICRRNVFARVFVSGDTFESTVEKTFKEYVDVIESNNATPAQVDTKQENLKMNFAKYMSSFQTSGNQKTDDSRIEVGLNHILGNNDIAKKEYTAYAKAVREKDTDAILKHGTAFLKALDAKEKNDSSIQELSWEVSYTIGKALESDRAKLEKGTHILQDNSPAKKEYDLYVQAVKADDKSSMIKHGVAFTESIEHEAQTNKHLKSLSDHVKKDVQTELNASREMGFIILEGNDIAKDEYAFYLMALQSGDTKSIIQHGLALTKAIETDVSSNISIEILSKGVMETIENQLPPAYANQTLKKILTDMAPKNQSDITAGKLFDKLISENFLHGNDDAMFYPLYDLVDKFTIDNHEPENTEFLYILHLSEKLEQGKPLSPSEIKEANRIFGSEVVTIETTEIPKEAISNTFVVQGAPIQINLSADHREQLSRGELDSVKNEIGTLFKTNTLVRLNKHYLANESTPASDALRMKAILYLSLPEKP